MMEPYAAVDLCPQFYGRTFLICSTLYKRWEVDRRLVVLYLARLSWPLNRGNDHEWYSSWMKTAM